MRIGDCWFDPTNGELKHQRDDKRWHLPRAELHVLNTLIAHQGSPVSKFDLRGGDDEYPPLSDSSVARAVCMLRSYLGPEHELLIETIKGKGYLLHSQTPSKSAKQASPRWRYCYWRWLLSAGLALLVMASLYYLNHHTDPTPSEPVANQVLYTQSGQQLQLMLYANSRTNNQLLMQQAEVINQAMQTCNTTIWHEVYASLSHDKQVLNMTLRGESKGQSVVRNLKISDARQPKDFINKVWLQGANLCG
ncbi:helix-turn-helix domain-containing protein [Shewanella avicenniae]|uniref:Helix-turn-helix domain-containing protein n=1 Tax=Shewanella avicenniae TaxID=2814294 RepID=A0ABX7QPH0_9GAMM|nr:helix-turn-helix domain-containing protein [Shewanella avicenniae]QSX32917.1 helix-turn-helix domain-containing protein [Shewanella avicenniae]